MAKEQRGGCILHDDLPEVTFSQLNFTFPPILILELIIDLGEAGRYAALDQGGRHLSFSEINLGHGLFTRLRNCRQFQTRTQLVRAHRCTGSSPWPPRNIDFRGCEVVRVVGVDNDS